MFKEPSNKVLNTLLSPPNEHHIKIYRNHCDRHKRVKNRRSRCSCFIGFQAYLVFSNKDIIGPVILLRQHRIFVSSYYLGRGD